MRAVLLLALFALSSFAVLAAGPVELHAELPAVAVQGESTARREYKTVADLLRVLDVFEREKGHYAPAAELRIRVLPRRDLADVPALELRHGTVREPIAIDALGRFTVPPAWRALPSDAIVRSPLLEGRLAWMVDVRTPGLAEGSRRLGDLRLECRADLHGGDLVRGVRTPVYALRPFTDLCTTSQVTYLFTADYPVFTAQLTEGDRRVQVPYSWMHGSLVGQDSLLFELVDWPFALRDRFLVLRLSQWKSWSDNALLELEPMTP